MAEEKLIQEKEKEVFDGFAIEDVELFEESPFWKALMALIQDRVNYSVDYLITDTIQDTGGLHKSNDSLRGGMIELGYVSGYPDRIKVIIKELEEIKLEEEEFSDGE